MPANIRPLANGALLTVIVGSTFHGELAPVVIPTAPTRQPPKVRRDPGATRSTLFKLRKRLPFTVEYPTLLESSSNLDNGYGETPVRIYPLGGQPTLRLTFRKGFNEYWGIQETRLGRRAGARRQEPHAAGRRARVRPPLHRLAPAHGRAARQRRDATGS